MMLFAVSALQGHATNFTMNVPGTGLRLPNGYPEAGGVAIVMIGANGNAYYQFSDPTGAFRGQQPGGEPAAFRGNPFTINNPIALDCGASACSTYFGGSIAQMYVRFTAYDGDTGAGEFDFNDITLRVNGFDVSNWSGVPTEITNTAGTVSQGVATGFTNNTYNTGWVSTNNAALLSNILTTGRTTSQIYDRDPGDNFWDFRIGNPLTNPDIVTVAPGYTLTKSSPSAAFATVGQQITYNFVIANIGSVPISNLTLQDDKIGAVTCTPNTLQDVNLGQPPNQATCTATYTVTQADVDLGSVTNIAVARGTPTFGVLGARQATLTIPGPARNPAITLDKATVMTTFGNAGTVVPYTFRVQNTGNVTLTNVVVTDPRLPGLSCTTATLAPNGIAGCTANYTITQANVDSWATANTPLSNTATVNARSPLGNITPVSDTQNLNGPTRAVSLILDKAAQVAAVTAAGQVIPYRFTLRNTGNITWPAPPTITDPLITGGISCPAGTVAPGASVVCAASYTVTQANVDAGQLVNTATASITVAGITGTATDTETLPATRTPSFTFDKRLAPASPTAFNNAGVVLLYEFAFANTGNTTLNALSVADPLIPAISCPASVAPGATAVCTGSYTTTQANLEAGQLVNTATPRATPAGSATPITGTADSVTVPAIQTRALGLDKTAPVITAGQFQVGQQVTYSYLVTNTGNVALPGPLTVIDDRAGTFQCQAGGLARGASVTCTRNYAFTANDILAGSVTNTATARVGTIASGQTTSNGDSVTIAPTLNPAITLSKAAAPTTATGTTTAITYTFTVTNSGNTQILLPAQPVTITDPRAPGAVCSQPATLNPGDSFPCTASTTPTQPEVDAGRITNRATASFAFTSGGQTRTFTTPEAVATVTIPATPLVDVAKSGPANFGGIGSTVPFSLVVTNTGNVTLISGSVTDPRIPGLACSFATLAPAATRNCTGSYTVTQADVDAGVINNTASVTAATAGGAQVSDTGSASVPINPANAVKSLTLEKVASLQTYRAGQQISYSFRVRNTGTQTLVNTLVIDTTFPAFTCTIPTLAPGALNTACVFNYTATQADVDRGTIVNAASAAVPGGPTATDSETITAVPRTANHTFAKTADGPFATAGDVVTFTLRVHNTGNTTLTGITIADTFFDPDLTCAVGTLAPGAADSSCVASYTVTQADVNAGRITNTASVAVTPQPGLTSAGPATASAVVQGPTAVPGLVVTKTPSATGYVTGQSVSFDFAVQNTGNVTLANVVLDDPALGFSCALADLAPGATATGCANAAPLTVTRTMTQADVDAGTYRNTVKVTATSTAPGGAGIAASDTVTLLGPVQAPALALAKTGAPGTFSAVGQTVTYSYVVTNTGNITLTAPITITDNRIAAVSCPAIPATGIAPGGTHTCTATAPITQANLNDGVLSNTATAQTVQPVVPRNPGDSSSVTVTSPGVTATVTATQVPALRLEKRVDDTSAQTFNLTSSQITYRYTVTNTGNVTTTAPITIDDDRIGNGLACTAALLAPGQSASCTQVWTATQSAIDAGFVTNTATANTTFNAAPVVSNQSGVTVPAQRNPAITITKTLVAPIPTVFQSGQVLHYSYSVTNTGNVTLAAPFDVADNLTTPDCPTQPTATFAPGGTFACTASYVIGGDDVDLGSTTNTAAASASFGGNPVVSLAVAVTFPLNAQPALTIEKFAPPFMVSLPAVGETVTYTYNVTNTGTGAFVVPVTVSDDKIVGEFTCWPPTAGDTEFDPGEVASCTADYTVTQDDLDRGYVLNTATAKSVYAPGGAAIKVESPSVFVQINGSANPNLTVVKSVFSGPNPAPAGATLTYQFVVENIGEQTLFALNVTDPLIPALSCSRVSLAVGSTATCTGTYTVTQADVDRGAPLENTATATAVSPQNAVVSHDGTVAHPLAPAAPSVEVTKALVPDPGAAPAFSGPGQVLTFRATVRNTGNITLTSTVVTDALDPAASCTVSALPPGTADSSCVFSYTTTQADVDRAPGPHGAVLNTVSALSQPATPASATVADTGSLNVLGPLQEPAFRLSKQADVTAFDAPGDVISYSYIITNAGNVTLMAQPSVTDDKIAVVACNQIPSAGLAPGEALSCTASYTVTQADVDAGTVVNAAAVTSAELPTASALARSTETVAATRTPLLQVTKQASVVANAAVGDTISYTYTVANAGNVTLTGVTPVDAHKTAAGTVALTIGGDAVLTDAGPLNDSTDAAANGRWDTLGPGDTVTFGASYAVTQADVDAGADLTNRVTVSATDPPGLAVPPATADASVALLPAVPGLNVQKRADTSALSSPPAAGQEIVYTITVANTGNVTLSEPDLTDSLTDANGIARQLLTGPDYVSGDSDGNLQLSVGERWIYRARVVITQAVLDAGGVANTATATVRTPAGAERLDASDDDDGATDGPDAGTDPTDDPTVTTFNLQPRLAAVKSGSLDTGSDGIASPGDVVSYAYVITNTGNATIRDVVPVETGFQGAGPVPVPAYVTGGVNIGGNADIADLRPGDSVTYAATYALTQADVNRGQVTNQATASGTNPAGGPVADLTGTTAGDDAPTVTGFARLPSLVVVKSVNTAALQSPPRVGNVLTYAITVRNTGNVTLPAPVLVDTLTATGGGALALTSGPTLAGGDDGDGALGVGETWTYAATFALTQAAIDAGGVSNTVTATVTDPLLGPVSDVSGTAANNNTPTTTALGKASAMALVKSATLNTGPDGRADAGDTVSYRYVLTNAGNTTLFDISLAETTFGGAGIRPVPGYVSGGGDLDAQADLVDLLPDATLVYAASYALTQADIDAGGVTNQATANGTTPDGAPISDLSADPDDADGNSTDDPTVLPIARSPGLTARKTLTSIGDAADEVAEFAITVTNSGNATLTGVGVTDNMTRFGGAPVGPITPAFVSATQASPAGTLLPAEVATYRVTYTLTQADVDAGGLENQATASGQPPSGPLLSDLSDNDGSGGQDDPTRAPIAQVSALMVDKALTAAATLFPTVERVTFTITVRNTGLTTQTALRVADDLAAFVAPATLLQSTYPVQISVAGFGAGAANPAYDGTSDTALLSGDATLPPGAAGTITLTATYSTAAGQPAGQNIAQAGSVQNTGLTLSNAVGAIRPDSDGDGVPDDLDGTGDRDGDGTANAQDYDPTGAFYCEDTGRILTGGSITLVQVGGSGAGINVVRNGTDGQYQVFVTAAGTYQLQITYPPGMAASALRPSLGTLDLGARLPVNPVSLASSQNGSTGTLADVSAAGNPWFDTFQIDAGDPYIINNNIPVTGCAGNTANATATKVADRDSAVAGDTVNFTLTFANGNQPNPDSLFVDQLPAGLIYTPGSATLNGAAVEPVTLGQRLTWGPANLGAAETVTIRLAARVAGSVAPGSLINRAEMVAADGQVLSNVATATIRITPEAVFDCTDVIGKVFDDINRNGVQDPFDARASITDQDMFLDKYGNLVPPALQALPAEPGIPGVRIATVNGLLITTDEFGRFHVPCAALPGDTGANFTLKLDQRTLPVGYALTTENPRTLRLTPGKVARMNFGAALTEMVDIGLTAQAFVPGTAEPVQALMDGVGTLIARIADTPSTLRLTYLLASGEDRAGALIRLRATEDLIRQLWRGAGSYDLQIDKAVKE